MNKSNPDYNPFSDVLSKHEAEEIRDIYYKVKVLNKQGKTVAHCKTKEEAELIIKQRREHSPLVGHAPRKYKIIVRKPKK